MLHFEIEGRTAERPRRERRSAHWICRTFRRCFSACSILARNSPGQLEQILSELADGRFSINTVSIESPRTARLQNQRTRATVSAILSVGLALLLTMPNLPVIAGVSAAWPVGITLVILYLSIAAHLRRLS